MPVDAIENPFLLYAILHDSVYSRVASGAHRFNTPQQFLKTFLPLSSPIKTSHMRIVFHKHSMLRIYLQPSMKYITFPWDCNNHSSWQSAYEENYYSRATNLAGTVLRLH